MPGFLIALDQSVFSAINGVLGTGAASTVFQWISRLGDWAAVWLALCFLVLWIGHGDEESHQTVVLTIAAILASELLTIVLKNAIARPRPAEILPHVRAIAPYPTGYSFPSAHAMRSFAAAGVLASYSGLRRWRWTLWTTAALIAFSRVAVGAHFPSDVIAGAILGCLIAWMFVVLGRRWKAATYEEDDQA